tara:strand:- start:74 stop:397 length:324 start_codon:yes stop_codon:yes gene_type:complete
MKGKAMESKLEPKEFENYQDIFVEEMIKAIMVKLVESGLEGRQMRELTMGIAFSVASIIDDTSKIEFNEEEIHPYLTFKSDKNELIHCGENSYTHELIFDACKKIFK